MDSKIAALGENPTPEQVAEAFGLKKSGAPPEKIEKAVAVADDGAEAEDGEPASDPSRPAWLDKRFKTPEELAKAYENLEKKLGQPKPPAKIEKPGEGKAGEGAALVLNAETMATFAQEYAENGGKLKDETYARLEKAGYTREVVDEYAALKQRDAERAAAETLEKVGLTPEALKPIYDWASANIPAEEIDALNELIQSPNPAKREIGLRQVKSAYDRANRATRRIAGAPSGTTVIQPISSRTDFIAATSDPKFAADTAEGAAYRKEVIERCKVGGYRPG